ncbi:MAG: DinB family protein [Pseudomonadota bacterium]
MITAAYCRTMARYNAWQNDGLRAAFRELPLAVLEEERDAFFGSIFGTANHLLWGDAMWMSRFDGWEKPEIGIPASKRFMPDLAMWEEARSEADARIIAWAESLSDTRLGGDLSWYSGAAGRNVTKPMAFCVAHFFNHQTHHRGQLHVMLTQAGWAPGDTDLFLMPE